LLHADFSKIAVKYSNEVHLLRYLTPLSSGMARIKLVSVPNLSMLGLCE
jgi:hypothetical protein